MTDKSTSGHNDGDGGDDEFIRSNVHYTYKRGCIRYPPLKWLADGSSGSVFTTCVLTDCNYVIKLVPLDVAIPTEDCDLEEDPGMWDYNCTKESAQEFIGEVDRTNQMSEAGISPKITDAGICRNAYNKYQGPIDVGYIVQEKMDTALELYMQDDPMAFLQNGRTINDMIMPLLQRMDDMGYTHLDLHEGNVMVDVNDKNTVTKVRIIDFGFPSESNRTNVDIWQQLYQRLVKDAIHQGVAYYMPSGVFFGQRQLLYTCEYNLGNGLPVLEVTVKIPRNYSSKLTHQLTKGEKPLAKLVMVLLQGELGPVIFIQSFYLYSRTLKYQKYATLAESNALTGFGKRMLCFGLREMSKILPSASGDVMVELEASGGECDDQAIDRMTLQEAQSILARYPKNAEDVEYDATSGEGDVSKLHRVTACAIKENRRLVKYYQGYGFEIVDDSDGLGVKMQALLSRVLEACGPVL